MNDLITKGIGLFPAYFRDLLALATGPKTFVSRRLVEDRLFERAFTFLAISYGAAFVLKTPLYERPLWIEAGAGAAFTVMIAAVCGVAIWLAWRGVGGTGTIAETLVITFYYAGIIEFILTFGSVGFLGALRAADPSLNVEVIEHIRSGRTVAYFMQVDRLLESRAFQAALLVPLLSMTVLAGWLVAGWGGFRATQRVGRVRSVGAFLIFAILLVPVAVFTFVMANALVG